MSCPGFVLGLSNLKRVSIVSGNNEGDLNMINFYFLMMLKQIIEPGASVKLKHKKFDKVALALFWV